MRPSVNCYGQWNHNNPRPFIEYVNQNHYTPEYFSDGYATEFYQDNFCSNRASWDQNVDEFDSMHDYPLSLMDHSSLDEISLYERLLSNRRELIRMKLTNQLKQLQSIEGERVFLKQMIYKQKLLSNFLSEEERKMKSTLTIKHDPVFENPQWMYDEEQEEKESSGKESWSHQSSSDHSMEHSSGSTEMTPDQADLKSTQPQDTPLKIRHCRHFLKGHCERGDSCGFRHDRSVFCTNRQKVFLRGLPSHYTATMLRQKLTENGYTVLNHPKVLRWFSPQVCLGSVEEAQSLIEKGSIIMDDAVIQVRPFEGYTRDNKKALPDEVERSVFLGGLALGTTRDIITEELKKLEMKVVNIPVVKTGYCPQVTLESVEQAQALLKLVRIEIKNAMVNVRPFANIRKSSGRKKNKSM